MRAPPSFTYRLPEEFRRVADYQVAGAGLDADAYLRQSEWEFAAAGPLLPTRPRRVLELGCGLGRASVYLNACLADPSVEFILADTTEIPARAPKAGWDPGDDFYNDLHWTSRFVEGNGLTNYRTFDIRRDDWKALPRFDLVISFLAVGFHFPIEPALPDLLAGADDDPTFLFGVRIGRYSRYSFADRFAERRVVRGRPSHPSYNKERFLALRELRAEPLHGAAAALLAGLDWTARRLQEGCAGLERRWRRIRGTLPSARPPMAAGID